MDFHLELECMANLNLYERIKGLAVVRVSLQTER